VASQPRVSWHLRILRHAQVIRTRRDGREVFCRLDRESISRHLQSFVQILSGGPEAGASAVSSRSIEAQHAPITEVVP